MKRHAHLVGSVGLADAETVFAAVSDILGDCCTRIPDGETGARGYWIRWQEKTFAGNPAFEIKTVTQSLPGFKDSVKRTFFGLKDDAEPDALELGALGYAEEAAKSYAVFSRLVADGKIAPSTRFQVSVPTPVALLAGFIAGPDWSRVEPALERAMAAEMARLQRDVPADRLSVQWDVCYEILGCDGGPPLHFAESLQGSVDRVGRLCGLVGDDAELGIHLCYGDPGHKHVVEPPDLSMSVAFANGICAASPRRVDFIHIPVPRNRSDDAYFRPLDRLNIPPETRLVLGLVHYTDGVEGSKARIRAAERHVADFDIATECGFGRRDPATIPDLLRIHRELCG